MCSRAQTLIFKVCFITSFTVTSLVVLLVGIILNVSLRLISVDLYRKAIWCLMVGAYAHVAFVADWWSLLELNLYMDKDDFRNYFGKEHALLVINHSYDIDWLPLVSICARMNLLGNSKIFAGRSPQYIPILGWLFSLTDYVQLRRSSKQNLKNIQDLFRNLETYPYPLWLLLYPENTWPTENSLRKSRVYAEQLHLPQLKHHLQPRTAEFVAVLREMRGRIKVVYNIEIAFRKGQTEPCCASILEGKQMIADIYLKRISEAEIPTDHLEQERFLREIFLIKDRLRNSFIKTGSFFTASGVPAESRFKIERPLYVVVIFFTCCFLVLMLKLWGLICLYQSYGITVPFYVLTVISTCSVVIFNTGMSATITENQ